MSKVVAIEAAMTNPEFDAEKFAADCILGWKGGFTPQELLEAEESVERRIRERVSSNYDSLLSSATRLRDLRSSAEALKAQSSLLKVSSDRIRSRIVDPFEKIQSQTRTLARMQTACDALRGVIRILQLIEKLQGKLDSSKEIAGAAAALSELSQLWTPDLKGINVLDQHERYVMTARNEVERSADLLLQSGLRSQNQSSIGTALQVYYNLGVLQAAVMEKVLMKSVKDVADTINDSLDAKKITASLYESKGNQMDNSNAAGSAIRTTASLLPTGNMSAFRAVLWNNIEGIAETVYGKTLEMIHTQRILCKKRDALTHVSFIETLSQSTRNLVTDFWESVLKILRENLIIASNHSHFIKQSIEGEYPKLLKLYNGLWLRLCQSSSAYSVLPGELPVPLSNPFNSSASSGALRDTLISFEQSYLSRSLSRLFDPIGLMFSKEANIADKNSSVSSSDHNIPVAEDLEEFFRVVLSELQIANVDERLSSAVSKNVVQAVHLFTTKCEQILITDGDASQVIGYPTAGQKRNVKIVNALHSFKFGILNAVASIECSIIRDSLSHVDSLAETAIMPLLTSIRDAIESIILTLHSEIGKKSDQQQSGNISSSLYMKELQAFISRVSVDYLDGFQNKEFIMECVHPIIEETIELFILHASLVRPLSKEGQMILTSDCAQLELALEPLMPKIKNSGLSYEKLRAFRALLYVQPEDIITSIPHIGNELLPASTVLHYLFSKASPEIKSPHQSADWSISRYSKWLKEHPSEKDRLQLIQGALESYVASTRQRNDKSYAYPYTVMLAILQKALS